MKKRRQFIAPLGTIMKVSFIQILLAFIAATYTYGHEVSAQELLLQKVDVNVEQKEIKTVLTQLESMRNIKFVYSSRSLPVQRRVSLSMTNKTISEVLDAMFRPDRVSYKIVRDRIVLTMLNPSSLLDVPIENTTEEKSLERTVTGRVTDETKEPLPGVNIAIKGTAKGTTTDAKGNFSLEIPEGAVILVFSFVGYSAQEINADNSSKLDAVLAIDNKSLNEVVVVGYGEKKKATLTGAIATIGAETFQNRGVLSNPVQALQGQVPGVTVTRSSGAPGREGWDFKIRGESSINGTGALVLIDGIPGSMSNMNPDDIETISILKDASAAIYGARAAGGVVLVTTKRGKNQPPKVTYKGNVAIKSPGRVNKWMDQSQWAYSMEEAQLNSGKVPGDNVGAIGDWAIQAMKTRDPQYYGKVVPYVGPATGIADMGFVDVDWNDVLWRSVASQSHSIGVQGGSDKSTYNLSLGYMDDNSVLNKWGEDVSRRFNIRLNNDFKITKAISFATSLAFERRATIYPSLKPNEINGNPPGSPVSTKSGLPYAWGGNYGAQWKSKLGGSVNDNVNSLLVNLKPTVKLFDGLNLVGNVSFNPSNTDYQLYENKIQWYSYEDVPYATVISPSNNKIEKRSRSTIYQNYQAYLDFNKDFGQHSVGVMAGASYEKNRYDQFTGSASTLSSQDIHSLNTGATKGAVDEIRAWALASYFGRVTYAFKGRYLLEALGRYDGSSRFTPTNRWKPFYGASAGWRLSDEAFMQSNGIFDDLKIRASYGETGNQNGIGEYDYIALLNQNTATGTAAGQFLFGSDASPVYGQTLTQSNVVSLSRTWEKIKNTNVGIDFSILKNRLTGTLDYFWKDNANMLASVTYPQVLGATAPKTNSGRLKVKGWEIGLNWRDKIGELSYFVSANLSDNQNKLISMQNASVKSYDARTSYLEGYALNSYWGHQAYKLIETQAELDSYKTINKLLAPNLLRIGDMMYKDTDGDGKITTADVVLLGDETLRKSYSFSFGGAWKGFDFNAIFQGVGKRTVIRNKSAATVLIANTFQNHDASLYGTAWSDIAEKYPDKNLPKVNKDPYARPKTTTDGGTRTYDYLYSDAWYRKQSGAYLRMKNVVLGYTIPKVITSKIHIDKLRIYFSGNDLFEFTKIKDGWDPETSAQDPFGGTVGSNAYPFARTYSFGLDLTF